MTFNRIEYQKLADDRRVLRFFGHVFQAMFNPSQSVTGAVLERPRLRLKPRTVGRRLAHVTTQRAIAVIRSVGERENRNRVSVVKPKTNRSFKLALSNLSLRKYKNPCGAFGSWLGSGLLTGQFSGLSDDSGGFADGCAIAVVPVMVCRCWNLPPVPLQRLWAVGFAAP